MGIRRREGRLPFIFLLSISFFSSPRLALRTRFARFFASWFAWETVAVRFPSVYVPARDYRHHYSQSSLTDPVVRETDLTLTASETKLCLIQTICFSHKNHSGKKLAISGDFFFASADILLLNGVLTEPCVTSRNYFTCECQKFDMYFLQINEDWLWHARMLWY